MSSLAATQADGYYVPPEYIDAGKDRKKSKNQIAGSKGHNQYLQRGVVRFELPYKGICAKCQVSIGKGTRFNAKKTKTEDSYFTTPIYEFEMKCRQAGCSQVFIIRTNPRERGFDYCSGIRIQAGQEPQLDGAATLAVADNLDADSALSRLEKQVTEKRKLLTEREQLEHLKKYNDVTKFADSDSNAALRKRFRKDRKDKKERLQHGAKKGWRTGMELLNSNLMDSVRAKATVYGDRRKDEKRRWSSVRAGSIFTSPTKCGPRKKRIIESVVPELAHSCASTASTTQRSMDNVSTIPGNSTTMPSNRSLHEHFVGYSSESD